MEELETKVKEYLSVLESAESNYDYQSILQDWKQKALEDEKAIWFLFKKIVNNLIQDNTLWNQNTNLAVGIFYVLIDIANEKAYALVKWFIQNFKDDTPSGAIELISTLIPSFPSVNAEEYFKYTTSKNHAQSALGFLTLFNLAMERKLTLEQEKRLYEISKTYTNDYHYVGHITDLLTFRFQRFDNNSEEDEKIDIQLVG